ncbi:hypothetical protein SAMN04489740_4091 [Arthrobacter alpinus]|uniref:Uncharacterized protein n=2 Tax=Arthrobacter alpinus TaxID=656366 RepID=A0A1H5PBL5_9MICC|nr:hypothetical protein SAMN04489740_4091 [Arthrobacter alpinus]
MRMPSSTPTVGSFLRWGAMVALAFAVIGGIFGMHVMGGADVTSMASPSMMNASTETVSVKPIPVSEHPVSEGNAMLDSAAHAPSIAPAACGCSSTGCESSMDRHQSCIPSLATAVVTLPLPDAFTLPSSKSAFLVVAGHKSSGRVPDPPSLNQLSISRT